jgi:hypothetical protein
MATIQLAKSRDAQQRKLTISPATSVLPLMDDWPGGPASSTLPPSSWKGAEERSAIETLLNE